MQVADNQDMRATFHGKWFSEQFARNRLKELSLRQGMKGERVENKSMAALLEIAMEIRSILLEIDEKLEHLIRNLHRFNHSHFNSVDESV